MDTRYQYSLKKERNDAFLFMSKRVFTLFLFIVYSVTLKDYIFISTDKTDLFDCGNGQHVLTTDVCNFHQDCVNGKDELNCADCTFENNQCGWEMKREMYSYFRWNRLRAGSDRIPVDHTQKDSTGK